MDVWLRRPVDLNGEERRLLVHVVEYSLFGKECGHPGSLSVNVLCSHTISVCINSKSVNSSIMSTPSMVNTNS
jgi:hypothetical protein